MKKIFLYCRKNFSRYAKFVERDLELMGYEVVFNDSFQINQENLKENAMYALEQSKDCDGILVLNLNGLRECDSYVDNSSFLLMYHFYLENKDIFLYNHFPFNTLYKPVQIMGAKPLKANLFNIEENYIKFKNNNLLNYFTEEQLYNIEKIENLYSRAFVIAYTVFKDKKDKAGKPYFDHLFRVSLKLDEEIEQVSALLHDIVEDTEVAFKDLLEIGFPIEILEIVKLVTKPNIDTSNMTKEEKLKLYNDEIDKIINSGNIHAIRLKKADMEDNYNKERLSELPHDKQEWFHEKYGKQLIKLNRITEKEKIL